MIFSHLKKQNILGIFISLFFYNIGNLLSQNLQVPSTLNIQGVLNNINGQPVTNGTYSITFRLYTSALGDVPEWSETQNSITVQSGIFNAILGKINPLNIPFDRPYFLGIKLGNEPEMEPRIELTSSAYSLLAKNVQNNSISTDKIQANAITIDKIASPIISSINGVTNDGGNLNLVAGNNISLVPDNVNKTITISASNGGTGTGSISSLTEGNGITIQNPNGPFPNIGLKPNILLGPGGSLGILNQNNGAVGSFSSDTRQNGFFSLSNANLLNTFLVSHFSDGQPFLTMNNKLGSQILDVKANEANNAEINLKSSSGNNTLRLSANETNGGLVNVFNQNGITAAGLTTTSAGNGRLMINSSDNRLLIDLKANSGGGGFFSLFNDESTESVRLSTSENRGGILSIRNRAGNTAVNLSTNGVGDGGLFVSSGSNKPVGEISTNVNGGGLFSIYNQDPVEVFRITTKENGQGTMRMNNRLGNRTAELMSNEFSDGEFTLHSVLTNPTVRLTANENAGGLVNVFNPQGDVAVRVTGEESGFIGIYNREKTEMIQMGILDDQNARITVNNRLGNPAADLFSNEFSDGELTLNSVLKNPVLRLTANDNAGGLINIFSKNNNLAAKLTEINDEGEFSIFNKEKVDIINMKSFLGDGSITLKNKPGFEAAGINGSTLGGFIYVADGAKTNGLNLRGVLNGGVGGGELDLYNIEGNKTMQLTTNFNKEGLLQIRSKSDKTKSRLELGSNANQSGFVNIFNKNTKNIISLVSEATTNEGLIRVASTSADSVDRLRMGGDEKQNGYLSLFNSKGLKTSIVGHNEFGDGHIELKNNLGNLGGYFTAFRDGGSIAVTDGKPGTNHRATLGSNLFGGRTTIFNTTNLMTHESSVQQNGEGIFRIVNPNEITKSRVEIGGTGAKSGFISTFDANNKRNIDLLANAEGAGIITTYKNDKIQTTLNSTTAGGDIQVFNTGGFNTSQIGHFDDGRGKIEVGHSNGTKVARMTSNSDGSGYIGVDNTDKNEVVRLTANTGKGGGIGVKNALNKDIFTVTQNQNHGVVLVHNAAGNNTGAIGHFEDGRGKIEVGHSDGTKVVRMTSNTDGSGFIGLDNNEKKEVVRITANNGKGGGIGIRNSLGNDIINLTQTSGNGTILVNNDKGSLLATITNNTSNGGFIGNKDQNGKDAVWLTNNDKGGGQVNTFNDQGNIITKLTMDAASRGRISVHGSGGNEIARMTATTTGEGSIGIDNNTGKNIAGMTNNTINGSGYVYANDANGKELARMTVSSSGNSGRISIDNTSGVNIAGMTNNSSTGAGYLFASDATGKDVAVMTNTSLGNGNMSIFNKTGTNIAGLTMGNASGGGYLYANHSNGKDVARMSTLAGGTGYMSVDNTLGKTVSYMLTSTLDGGYIGVTNSAGNDRARITTNANGAGHISASNSTGANVVQLSVSNSNHGEISTSNASGAIINAVGATGTAQGYIAANNSAGQERAFVMGGANGGEIGVNDNSGKLRVLMAAASGVQVNDVDGSYLQIYNSGSSTNMILVDKFQHPRAEVKSGTILAKGPNGIEHSFMSSATAPNLGYIGVCNSNLPGSPVKAGMYTTAGNQGVIFADVKNFKMDYPGKPDKQIWYGSLEGPELAAYIRGTGKIENGKATIEFPDHFIQVANASTMTVMVTPLSGKSKGLAVVKKTISHFSVEELMEGNGSYEFDWEVKCVRKGHEDFEVVRNKSDEPKPFIETSSMPSNMISGNDRVNHSVVKEAISPAGTTKNQ